MSPFKVTITGAGGFLGSACVARLAKHPGVAELRALYSAHNPPAQNQSGGSKLRVFTGELGDKGLCRELVRGTDVVLHFASRGFPSDTVEDPALLVNTNVTAAGNLMEAMSEARVTRFVLASSAGAIYRPIATGNRPFRETDEVELRSPYALYKLAVENLASYYALNRGLSVYNLRISNPYGPGQFGRERQGILGLAAQRALSGQPLTLWGSPQICKDFIFIDDVVSAFETFVFHEDLEPGCYHVGSGTGTTLKEALTCVEKVVGKPLKLTEAGGRSTDSAWTIIDTTKLKRTTGWHCTTSLEDGIAKMLGAALMQRAA